jgi:hypothetical protein
MQQRNEKEKTKSSIQKFIKFDICGEAGAESLGLVGLKI